LRNDPVILKGVAIAGAEDSNIRNDGLEPEFERVGETVYEVAFTPTEEWTTSVRNALNPHESATFNGTVDATHVEKLHSIFVIRLKEHIRSRIVKEEKHDHWCWSFVKNNLYRVCRIMLMMGHVRSDLDCTSPKVSLLSDSTASFVLVGTDEISKLEGCYLYKDPHCGFIRSGKTIGRSFADRHKEHARCALSQDTRSKFYS
jgi:hypothetical protein